MKNTEKKSKRVRQTKEYKPGSLPYIWSYIKRSPSAMIGLCFIVVLLILSFLTPYISPYSYRALNIPEKFQPPSWAHWLGTDSVGRDQLTRILYGARYTLTIGLFSTAFSLLIGVPLGAISGYFGGVVDTLIMRFLDVFQSFPNILLAIALSAAFGPGFWKIIWACGLTGITGYARMIRASILSVREAEYIEAARSINCSNLRLIIHHILPNAFSPCIVLTAMSIASSGLAAASLSFLGFGVQAPTPEWGSMLSGAREFIRYYPYLAVWPGLFIMLSVLCFNLIGDAVRDALDPRLKV